MDRTIDVRTPESIAFSYELAGLGSRFLAMLLDMVIQFVLAGLIFWGLLGLASHAGAAPKMTTAEEKTAQSIAIALIVFLLFLLFFGYFIIFEAAWNGQTPGKRLIGIRVVRDGGYPIDFMSSLIRNLVRTLEFGLGFYALSAVVSLASNENKRLGDYAAGTIVVRDSAAAAPSFAPATGTARVQLSDEERALVGRFLARRGDLLPARRAELARQIAELLRARVEGETELRALPDETLIERIDA